MPFSLKPEKKFGNSAKGEEKASAAFCVGQNRCIIIRTLQSYAILTICRVGVLRLGSITPIWAEFPPAPPDALADPDGRIGGSLWIVSTR